MNRTILVIDDQSGREELYQGLCTAIGKAGALTVDMVFVDDPNKLIPSLQLPNYSAILVDGVLTGKNAWPDDRNLIWALGQIRTYAPTIPMALVSSNWGDIKFSTLNDAWVSINCRALIRWEDIENKDSYVVSVLQTLIYMSSQLTSATDICQGDPIRILHLSDLQFGGFNEKHIEMETARLGERVLEKSNNKPPNFIAITGDIAEHGMPIEYDSAKLWLEKLCIRLGFTSFPRDRMWIVPGNHDVNMPLGVASRISVRPPTDEKGAPVEGPPLIEMVSKIEFPELLAHAYRPYRDFVSAVCGPSRLDLRDASGKAIDAWVETRFRHLGLIAYGVNTAQPFDGFDWPQRSIDSTALSTIGAIIGPHVDAADSPLVIGLGHHSPLGQHGKRSVANPEAFELLFNSKVKTSVFFHGHIHTHEDPYVSQEGYRMLRFAAPTFTKPSKSRPEDTLRGLNLVVLTRDEKHFITEVIVSTFSWLNNNLSEIRPRSNADDPPEKRYVRHRRDGMFKEEIR